MTDLPLYRMSEMRVLPEIVRTRMGGDPWLPQHYGQVVHLKNRGFTHVEIARITQRSLGAVNAKVIQLRRARWLP